MLHNVTPFREKVVSTSDRESTNYATKIKRLKEIIEIAYNLRWIQPRKGTASYPLMQISEVEKCMVAMFDDFELGRMREWNKEAKVNLEVKKTVEAKEGESVVV